MIFQPRSRDKSGFRVKLTLLCPSWEVCLDLVVEEAVTSMMEVIHQPDAVEECRAISGSSQSVLIARSTIASTVSDIQNPLLHGHNNF